MRLVVCIKQIPDPELPLKLFQVDREKKKVLLGEARRVINPFDENALEVALRFRDNHPETEIVAITVGGTQAEEVLRKALALTVNQAVLVKVDTGEEMEADFVAELLARAIETTGGAEVILCGRQAGDWDRGQVGPMMAQSLDVPSFNNITKIEQEGNVRVFCEIDNAVQVIEGEGRFVGIVTNSKDNVLRMPKVKDTMQALRKPLTTLSIEQLGIVPASQANRLELVDVYISTKEVDCELVPGENEQEKVANLIEILRSRKLIPA